MKRILTTLAQKWPEYLLEILVITIGILGAFMLNNWNESRKSNIEETKFLLTLKNEFINNQESLLIKIESHERVSNNLKRLVELIQPNPDTIDKNLFDTLMISVVGFVEFSPGKTAIESPILEQMNDDDLNKLLADWTYHMEDYNNVLMIVYDLYWNSIYPYLGHNYQFKNLRHERLSLPRSKFHTDNQSMLRVRLSKTTYL